MDRPKEVMENVEMYLYPDVRKLPRMWSGRLCGHVFIGRRSDGAWLVRPRSDNLMLSHEAACNELQASLNEIDHPEYRRVVSPKMAREARRIRKWHKGRITRSLDGTARGRSV